MHVCAPPTRYRPVPISGIVVRCVFAQIVVGGRWFERRSAHIIDPAESMRGEAQAQ